MFQSGAGLEVLENKGFMTTRVYLPWQFIVNTTRHAQPSSPYEINLRFYRIEREGCSVTGVLISRTTSHYPTECWYNRTRTISNRYTSSTLLIVSTWRVLVIPYQYGKATSMMLLPNTERTVLLRDISDTKRIILSIVLSMSCGNCCYAVMAVSIFFYGTALSFNTAQNLGNFTAIILTYCVITTIYRETASSVHLHSVRPQFYN
jgi:hypothetical protein